MLTHTPYLPRKQTGVALFISLVLLLVLTIIGVSAVQTTSLEVRMTRNDHDSLLAFQAAEAALVDAERLLDGPVSLDDFRNAALPGYYPEPVYGQNNRWDDANVWTGGTSIQAPAIAGVAGPATYIIEFISTVQIRDETAVQITPDFDGSGNNDVQLFRITARGIGGTDNARVLLQSTFGKVIN